MGQVDEVRARHELELSNAALEDELVALKASGKDPDRLREVKSELRELRRFWREIRDLSAGEPADGDAVAKPAAVKASGKVQEG